MVEAPRPPVPALALALLASAALIAGAWWLTRDRIAAAARAERLAALAEVLPPTLYDNDPLADRIEVRDRALGSDAAVPVYRARLHGRPAALVLEAIAPNGYNGPIRLRIGIAWDGTLTGVRVLEHRETPGLGGQLDSGGWLARFAGRSLHDPPEARWKVRKDGGDFDQFSGATVTPRAVVEEVRKVLAWYAANRAALFAPAPP
ncbi:electron transport complex subunit G [Mizugakiibacter sediminis]|uniref:Ion-translocating oxidoreductase complex subunit G n=1 Tax=Mizugakiibacter sediminis TaxID=1475481 RepID=A0A0K8QL61_9GAMM|nr:electron transport complex subunit RsxG [Mizugakiibacter sediminis]GAP65446.1 electron transport complex subunit G [Mizugakiibacter sediminis]